MKKKININDLNTSSGQVLDKMIDRKRWLKTFE